MKIQEPTLPEGIPPSAGKVGEVAPGKVSPRTPGAGPPPADQVELSPGARELYLARTLLHQVPEIREELVKDLKQRIQDGSYEIDVMKVAEELLREIRLYG